MNSRFKTPDHSVRSASLQVLVSLDLFPTSWFPTFVSTGCASLWAVETGRPSAEGLMTIGPWVPLWSGSSPPCCKYSTQALMSQRCSWFPASQVRRLFVCKLWHADDLIGDRHLCSGGGVSVSRVRACILRPRGGTVSGQAPRAFNHAFMEYILRVRPQLVIVTCVIGSGSQAPLLCRAFGANPSGIELHSNMHGVLGMETHCVLGMVTSLAQPVTI